jgi:hypothetical protein
MPDDAPDFDEASEDEKNFGMWISEDTPPYFSDGSDAYRIV